MILGRKNIFGNETFNCRLQWGDKNMLLEFVKTCLTAPLLYSLPTYLEVLILNLIFGLLVDYVSLHRRIRTHSVSIFVGVLFLLTAKSFWEFLVVFSIINLFMVVLMLSRRVQAQVIHNFNTTVKLHVLFWLIFGQFMFHPDVWDSMKTIIISAGMKVISLSVDAGYFFQPEKSEEILAYLFCPATLLFGPFITYSTYLNEMHSRQKDTKFWMFVMFIKICRPIAFLFISQCLLEMLIPVQAGLFLNLWKEGFQYRIQYYYLSSILEMGMAAACFKSSNHISYPENWQFLVADILRIELGSTLISPVLHWDCAAIIFYLQYIVNPIWLLNNGVNANITLITGIFVLAAALIFGDVSAVALVLLIGVTIVIQTEFCNMIERVFGLCLSKAYCVQCHHKYPKATYVTKAFSWMMILTNLVYLTTLSLDYARWSYVFPFYMGLLVFKACAILVLTLMESSASATDVVPFV